MVQRSNCSYYRDEVFGSVLCCRMKCGRGVVVLTTARFHSTKLELRFCAVSNPADGVVEIAMLRISDSGPGWKKS